MMGDFQVVGMWSFLTPTSSYRVSIVTWTSLFLSIKRSNTSSHHTAGVEESGVKLYFYWNRARLPPGGGECGDGAGSVDLVAHTSSRPSDHMSSGLQMPSTDHQGAVYQSDSFSGKSSPFLI